MYNIRIYLSIYTYVFILALLAFHPQLTLVNKRNQTADVLRRIYYIFHHIVQIHQC